jgi:ribonuclease HI
MKKNVIIYTDGSCSGNPGPGGWAAVLIYGTHKKEFSGAEAQTTNNRMELRAAVEALSQLKEPCKVELHTDSAYMQKAFTEGWIQKWMRNGWRTAARKPVENQDLWKPLVALTEKHDVQWKKVKGHSDNELNNLVDELAVQVRKDRFGV